MAERIKAVHDNDLDEVLKNFGVFSKFIAGKLFCSFCKDIISYNNLHSIFPDSGSIKFTCSKADCVMALMTKLEEKQYGNYS